MADAVYDFSKYASRVPLATAGKGIAQIVAQKRQKEMMENYQGLLRTATETNNPQDWFAAINAAPPDRVQQLTKAYDTMTALERQKTVQENMGIISALGSGNEDIALSRLEEMALGYENEGELNDAKVLRGFVEQIQQGKGKQVMDFLTMSTGVTKEGQDALQSLFDMRKGEESRLMTEADVIKTMQEAGVTTPEEKQRLGEALEGAPFNYGQKLAELIPILGSSDVKKMTPSQRANLISGLRKEYTKDTAPFRAAETTRDKMASSLAQNTSQGDVGALFLFMKMLDENSVVRESEFRTASNMGSLLDSLKNTADKWVTGQRLQPGQKENLEKITSEFYRIMDEKKQPFDERMKYVVGYYGPPEKAVMFDEVEGPVEERIVPEIDSSLKVPSVPLTEEDVEEDMEEF